MADLSTISSADPADAEAVANGASRIRALCDAIKTSFGGAAAGAGTQTSEHYLKGFHKFPNGDGTYPFSLPAGNNGRLFLDNTNGRILQDSAGSWFLMRTVAGAKLGTVGPVSGGASSVYATLSTVTVNVPATCTILILTSADVVCTVDSTVQTRVFMDGTTSIFPLESPVGLATAGTVNRAFGMWTATQAEIASTGNHTFALQLRGNMTTAPTATNILIVTMQI